MHKKITTRIYNQISHRPKTTAAVAILLLWWLFCLPRPLFDMPFSTVLEDQDGHLLGARIASDGQWRFPVQPVVPEKYQICVTTFEDKRFWYHPGIDPVSLVRALWYNLRRGRVVNGGSTISMQVIRLAHHNPPRTVWEKIKEVFMATRLELTHRKKTILALYAAHAPFGGNVVGLEAASWRYFGKQPELLSWSEAAMLAVLPNSPSLIHPGRNRTALLNKRNRLLETLRDRGTITDLDCSLAQSEPLPAAPLPLPQLAPHLLEYWRITHPNQNRIHSTLRAELQQQVTDILSRRQTLYRGNEVHNLAAVVIDVPTGAVLAYVGNAPGAGADHGESVNMPMAARSTGSILKPYLYALGLESGTVLPGSLLEDVPTQLGSYKPENFMTTYDGAVAARRALIRSLNVPFVLMLQDYGLAKFHLNLQRLGLSTINRPAEHYGLTLILGGAEANLLDIANTYACMARRLGAFYTRNGRYDPKDFRAPAFEASEQDKKGWFGRSATTTLTKDPGILSAGAIWFTFEAMREVERPNNAGEWEMFRSHRPVAWKTGTSFGFRDAWAAGVTPRYAVGVWVGNADGEGRPGLLGVSSAAPVLFDIFSKLPDDGLWFDPPYDDMRQVPVCRHSGWRAGDWCPVDTVWIPRTGLQANMCSNCQLLHLDETGQWQVNSNCVPTDRQQHRAWFVLPPIQEFYFKSKNPAYQSPPSFRPDCLATVANPQSAPMQLLYPRQPTRIFIPVDADGKLGSTIFEVAHRKAKMDIYWHLDGQYLGTTRDFHQMALQPAPGKHQLALVDKEGNRIEQLFEVVLPNASNKPD